MLRSVSIFSGLTTSKLGPSAGDIACSTYCAIDVPLAAPNIFHVKSHFRGNKHSALLVEDKVNSKSSWYEINDGNYHHQTIMLLMDTELAW